MNEIARAGTGAGMTGHRYLRCEVCDGTDPHWTIMRRGDVVVSWACDNHLATVCERLQRDFEITELIVTDGRKARKRAAISRALRMEGRPEAEH